MSDLSPSADGMAGILMLLRRYAAAARRCYSQGLSGKDFPVNVAGEELRLFEPV